MKLFWSLLLIFGVSLHVYSHGTKTVSDSTNTTVNNYYSSGKLRSITTYSNGKKNGVYTKFSSTTNQVIQEGQYFNNLRDGEWISYNSVTGLVSKIMVYNRGKLIN